MRLDLFLVARGDYQSRHRAAEAIKDGQVAINGAIIYRPAHNVTDNDNVACEAATAYVSRGGVKLAHALAHFAYPVAGKVVCDIGASTGGFSDVLIKGGAAHIYAIDVGHNQLAPALKADSRVSNLEGINARDLDMRLLSHPIDALVCDVSFISLKLALPPALQIVQAGGWLIALIKPQFEVGRAHIGKGGIVRDPQVHTALCEDISAWVQAQGWQPDGIIPSPILGAKGNAEFLIGATRLTF